MDELILLQKENEWLREQNKALGEHIEKATHANSLLRKRNEILAKDNAKLSEKLNVKRSCNQTQVQQLQNKISKLQNKLTAMRAIKYVSSNAHIVNIQNLHLHDVIHITLNASSSVDFFKAIYKLIEE